jgi:hypothetical protein
MDRCHEYAIAAGGVRRAWELLAKVDSRLLEMQRGHLAAKVLDIEAELLNLHGEIVQLAQFAVSPSTSHQLPHRGQQRMFEDDVPF